MPKAKLSKLELAFVLFMALALFAVTVHLMSMDGILPGNDPAVHLAKAETIIANKGVAYSDIPWYPPLFHAFLATFLLLAGTLDIAVAALLVKLMVAAVTVLILLSTYVLSKRFLGVGVAVCAAIFTFISVAFFEMIFWGGYPSYLGLAYIPFILYVAYANFSGTVKASLLVLMSFTLVLTHQLSAFVFFLIFVPAFFVSSIRHRGRLLVFLAIIIGGGLGILAWYGDMIMRYWNVMFEHLFFGTKEYIYNVPSANLESFIKVFGITLILGIVGIPLAFISLKKRKLVGVYLLLVLWLVVPFLLSQSYLFGIYILYGRFIPYLATPIAILAGVSAYNLTKLPSFLSSKFSSVENRGKWKKGTQIVAFALLLSLFLSQSALSLQQINSFPWYYEVSGASGVNASQWLQQHALSQGVTVVSEKPGSWLHAITNFMTMEETDPVYGRNAAAEAVEYLFFEIQTNSTLIREYALNGPLSGQVFYTLVNNVWEKVFSISDYTVYVVYTDKLGNNDVVSLSEIPKTTYWTQKTADSVQMVSEYAHPLFTVKKQVSINQSSSSIDMKWIFTSKDDLADAKLRIYSQMDPNLSFQEALIPGLLQWLNPWASPSKRVDPQQTWAVIESPPDNLTDSIVALRDSTNGRLSVFEFDAMPDWFNVGALENQNIDAVRVGYEFGVLAKNESRQISFSVATASFEPSHFSLGTVASLRQFMNAPVQQTIQARDYLTYIDSYNVEFAVVSAQELPVDLGWTPSRNLIYYDGKLAVYAIKH